MLVHGLVKKDKVIYWEKIAVDDDGESIFAEPVIILARWDTTQHQSQSEDVIQTETRSNTVYPDRVLAVGSYLMLGNETDRDNLTEKERRNPRLVQNARQVGSQSVIFELGWEQYNVKPGYKSIHVTIEASVG